MTDNKSMVQLFYNTVHTVSAKDYTEKQISVWAPDSIDVDTWCRPFAEDDTLIAEERGKIIGFVNMDNTGYIDRLYVHSDYQGQGIASMLIRQVESLAQRKSLSELRANVSITARPFFLSLGYREVHENIVTRNGVSLINYTMIKSLDSPK